VSSGRSNSSRSVWGSRIIGLVQLDGPGVRRCVVALLLHSVSAMSTAIDISRLLGPGDYSPPDDDGPTPEQVWRNDSRVLENFARRLAHIADPDSVGDLLDPETDEIVRRALSAIDAVRDRILARIDEI
jgi:hypothetical protein